MLYTFECISEDERHLTELNTNGDGQKNVNLAVKYLRDEVKLGKFKMKQNFLVGSSMVERYLVEPKMKQNLVKWIWRISIWIWKQKKSDWKQSKKNNVVDTLVRLSAPSSGLRRRKSWNWYRLAVYRLRRVLHIIYQHQFSFNSKNINAFYYFFEVIYGSRGFY